MALITLVRCSTGENWNGIMYSLAIAEPFCSEGVDGDSNCGYPLGVVAIYWVSFFVITNIVLISLLTAAVLDAFAQAQVCMSCGVKSVDAAIDDDVVASRESSRRTDNRHNSCHPRAVRRIQMSRTTREPMVPSN
jgi:hypothetical protein